MKELIKNFIPIFIIYLFVTNHEAFLILSNTILGRLFVIAIIIFYASIDSLIGVLVALLFVYYYQSDSVEGLKKFNIKSWARRQVSKAADLGRKTVGVASRTDVQKSNTNIDGLTKSVSQLRNDVNDIYSKNGQQRAEMDTAISSITNRIKLLEKPEEGVGNIVKQGFVGERLKNTNMSSNEIAKYHFRQQHCKNGHLMKKDCQVHPEMTEHVFPEVTFPKGKCNICDGNCDVIIGLDTYETLVLPKSSNDWMDYVWNQIQQFTKG